MRAVERGCSGADGSVQERSRGAPVPLLHLLRRVSRSFAAKLFVVLLLVLLLAFGALGYLNVQVHRSQLEVANLQSAQRLSRVVQRSTSYHMLRNDREALGQIVHTIGGEPGIVRLRILDHTSRVGFSTDPGEIGSRVIIPGAEAATQQAHILTTPAQRVLSITTPIPNSATCSSGSCHAHPASQQMLGLLDVNLSLAQADAEVRRGSWHFVAYSALGIFVALASTGFLVWRFVHQPVRALRRGTVRLGQGELGVQLPVRSEDELGELAQSFNAMSLQLQSAREEATAWARTLEDRVRSKTSELTRAHDQMIQAEKLTSLGKLAAVVAHEINNPLSGILTYARLLRKWIERGDSLEERAPDMRDSLELIERESRRCGDIVRNLLTFARVHPMNISDFDLNRIVIQTVRLVEHKLDLGNIVPDLDLGPGLPLIRGDAAQIEQLLLALVMNAIEAMPREGNLHVATAGHTPGEVTIVVEDNGMGIPPEIVPHLYEPFTTTKEEGKGVGLGLAISRAIIDRHAGRIDVQSEPGRGTRFTITLPVGREGGEAVASEGEPLAFPAAGGNGKQERT